MFNKRLLKEFKENQKYVAGMVITSWAALAANVVLIYFIASYIGSLLKNEADMKNSVYLMAVGAVVLVLRAVMNTLNSKLSFAASTNVKRRLRQMIYNKLMAFGTGYREKIATSEAVQISTEGVEQLEIYFGKYVPQFFYSLLAPLTLFAIVSTMSLKVAVVLLVCVPLIPVSIVAVQKFAKKMLAKYWGTYTELGDSFLENLQGLTTLKIYEADGRYAKKMDEESEKFRKVTMKVLIMQLNSISIMDLVAYGGAAAGIILSVLECRAGNLSFVQCFFIILISAEFFLPLRLLGSFFHIAMNGNAAANKIFVLMDKPVSKEGSAKNVSGSDIVFDNVTFGYTEDKAVLKNISLVVSKNSFTALVGVSGCGKSTMASLMMGDLSGFTGSISIGQTKVGDIAPGALYEKMTRIRHDSYLFGGTVEENLRMGKENAAQTELYEALRKVDLYDTIMEKGGLSMEIEERAANLSGGQKQRLCLARAILHNSDIYIFDEATSNIDVESENKIMEVIRELAKTKTVVLISHRLANVACADQIAVLKEGRIIQQGSHEALMGETGYYRELYSKQRSLENYSAQAAADGRWLENE